MGVTKFRAVGQGPDTNDVAGVFSKHFPLKKRFATTLYVTRDRSCDRVPAFCYGPDGLAGTAIVIVTHIGKPATAGACGVYAYFSCKLALCHNTPKQPRTQRTFNVYLQQVYIIMVKLGQRDIIPGFERQARQDAKPGVSYAPLVIGVPGVY